jgi:hypothetical protein
MAISKPPKLFGGMGWIEAWGHLRKNLRLEVLRPEDVAVFSGWC